MKTRKNIQICIRVPQNIHDKIQEEIAPLGITRTQYFLSKLNEKTTSTMSIKLCNETNKFIGTYSVFKHENEQKDIDFSKMDDAFNKFLKVISMS